MPNEDKKDFNAMLRNSKDMPKMQVVTDPKTIEKYGGSKMFFAPPMDYDRVMRTIPFGRVITVGKIREYLARQNGADFTEPMTAGMFVNIAAWASFQRTGDETPYWRTLKADGELNDKYPGGVQAQKERLESEGHVILQRGRKNVRYFVRDYERALFSLTEEPADALQEAILRIERMEKRFDFVTNTLQNAPEKLRSSEIREAVQMLSDYYENGDWLHDYELDEQGLLPSDLRRGVLSQDGLYDLLGDLTRSGQDVD